MDQLRTLLWLKWRLMVRSYERTPMRIVGLLLFAVIFGVMSVAIAGLCFAGFRSLGEDDGVDLLHMLLFGLWAFWLLMPVFGFSLAEGYDITKQLVFPIPRLRMFIASILSNLIGAPVVSLLPLAAAVILGFSARPVGGFSILSAQLNALVLGVFFLHMLSLSQTLLIMLLGVLRSRRYQDILTIFLPFIGLLFYLGFHLLFRGALRQGFTMHALMEADPARYLMYAPSGMAAEAIDAVSDGDYGRFALGLALLTAVTALVFVLGSHVMQRVYEGEIIDSRRLKRSRAPGRRGATRGPLRRWLRIVPAPLLAITLKELRYLWRDPQMKSMLLGLVVPVIWIFVAARWGWSPRHMPALIGAMFIFAGAPFSMNAFGFDRAGLYILFLFPSDRRLILIGKNVLGLVILIGAGTVGLTGAALWLKQPAAVATTLPFLVAASFVSVAGGNVASVYYPLRVVSRGENPFSRSAEQGCMTNAVRALVFQIMMLATLPIVAGFLTPQYLRMPSFYLVTAPVSIAYGVAVYAIVLPYAAAALLQRETRLIEICTASEEP